MRHTRKRQDYPGGVLAGRLQSRLVREVARELLEEKGRWWNVLDNGALVLFQTALFHTHLFLIHQEPRFVADRSIIDHMAYVQRHVDLSFNSDMLPLYREMESWVSTHLRNAYDVLVYYSPEGLAINDEQRDIDERVRSLMSFYSPRVIEITRDDVNTFMRVAGVMRQRMIAGAAAR